MSLSHLKVSHQAKLIYIRGSEAMGTTPLTSRTGVELRVEARPISTHSRICILPGAPSHNFHKIIINLTAMHFSIFYSILYFLNAGHDPLTDFTTHFWVATHSLSVSFWGGSRNERVWYFWTSPKYCQPPRPIQDHRDCWAVRGVKKTKFNQLNLKI